jgi:S-adenosylmethionine hydrolase
VKKQKRALVNEQPPKTTTREPDSMESSSRVYALDRSRQQPVITLLTDFGTADYFVGAVKGAILTINPDAGIIDITHEIPPLDVECAAFTLLASCSAFPEGTIHVAVVDPGVGSERRSILIRTRHLYFIGPDNGIFSYACDRSDKTALEVFHLDNPRYFRQPVSKTFHGRDVFAPVAAALSNGVNPDELGTRITDYIRLPSITPQVSRNGEISARIIHIDRFGNCVTNLTPAELTAEMIAAGVKLRINGSTVKSFKDFFTERPGKRDQPFGIWGSAGFLEIAVANKSAAKLLKAKRGDAVTVSKNISER